MLQIIIAPEAARVRGVAFAANALERLLDSYGLYSYGLGDAVERLLDSYGLYGYGLGDVVERLLDSYGLYGYGLGDVMERLLDCAEHADAALCFGIHLVIHDCHALARSLTC